MTETRMPQDWHVAAYEAAQRRDHEAICATLEQLGMLGRHVVEEALHTWMDRTEYVLTSIAGPHRAVGFALEADDGDGAEVPHEQAPPLVVWAGRLFMAHIAEDDTECTRLWSKIGDDDLLDAVYSALGMLVLTAESFAETASPPPTYRACPPDPTIQAARLARAHLN